MSQTLSITAAPSGVSTPAELTPIKRRPGIDFSLTGLVYCLMMLVIGIAAMNGQVSLLFGVFGLMIGVMLVSGVICRMVLRRLKVKRELPEFFVVGRPATVVYYFKNQKYFWPSLSVTLSELDGAEAFTRQVRAYLLHAAAGVTAKVPVEVMPKRRGQHQMGAYQLSTSFPFGFIKRAVQKREADTMLVCPPLGHVSPQLLALCRADRRIEGPLRPRQGGQDEFYGVKEHRAGDNPKLIYWRRSARTPGVLVAKEMSQVAPPRLMLLIDNHLPRVTSENQAAIEKSLAMAASLANVALDVGLEVGLCSWDGDGWQVLAPQAGKRQRREIMSALAQLPRNSAADAGSLMTAAATLVKPGISAIVFTPQSMQTSLADRLRGAFIVVAAESRTAAAWFSFDASVDFGKCSPIERGDG